MDEFGLIARFFAPLAAAEPGALGLKDDAAVLSLEPGTKLVVTTDALVAGVHFFPDDPADDIARKLMRVNLSDLAAMGARPRGVLLAAAFPRAITEDWLVLFASGIGEDSRSFAAPLVGGDTVATDGPLTLTLTALGEAQARVLTRSAARAGDDIYVSGTIGDAALGLMALKGERFGLDDEALAPLVTRYLVPEPRLALGRLLAVREIARACIDVSDGLIADLGHIAECSGLAAEITAAAVPLSPAAERIVSERPALRAALLTGGDDYELCFTAALADRENVAAAARAVGLPATRIGTMGEGKGVTIKDAQTLGIDIEGLGFSHF